MIYPTIEQAIALAIMILPVMFVMFWVGNIMGFNRRSAMINGEWDRVKTFQKTYQELLDAFHKKEQEKLDSEFKDMIDKNYRKGD